MSDGRLKSELRITAGSLRGRRVAIPRGEVRPTSSRARQAYFNIIGDRISGARFLDLFAGSGIFSLEALSRGAAHATAVDTSRQNLTGIARTAAALGVQVETVRGDALTLVLPPPCFDLVYADPPYDFGRYDALIANIGRAELTDDAVVAVEHRRHSSPFTVAPSRLRVWRRAEYGEVWITLFTAAAASGLQ